MEKYVCDVCGYVYDEAAGDPDNGIAPRHPLGGPAGGFCLPSVRGRQGHVLSGIMHHALRRDSYQKEP